MNGRLESRPTGRLESLPYESARMVFSGGEKFPCLLAGRMLRRERNLPRARGPV